jgi:hypothetical protein
MGVAVVHCVIVIGTVCDFECICTVGMPKTRHMGTLHEIMFLLYTSNKYSLINMMTHDSLCCIALGYGLDGRVFESRQGMGIVLFTASRPALGLTQPPVQWVPGALLLGTKWPRREADHSPPSSAEVKNAWSYTSTPQYAFMA